MREIYSHVLILGCWFSVWVLVLIIAPHREVLGCQECNLIMGDDGFLHDAEDCAEESIYFVVFV